MALIIGMLSNDIGLLVFRMSVNHFTNFCLYLLHRSSMLRFNEGESCEVSEERTLPDDIFVFESHMTYSFIKTTPYTLKSCFKLICVNFSLMKSSSQKSIKKS